MLWRAKQRELAVHLASIQVHEQLASLQEGWASRSGWPSPAPRRSGCGSFIGLPVWSWRSSWRRSRLSRKARRRRDGTGRGGG
jgi:hypothetical protein